MTTGNVVQPGAEAAEIWNDPGLSAQASQRSSGLDLEDENRKLGDRIKALESGERRGDHDGAD